MDKQELTCIGCPLGCQLSVEITETNENIEVIIKGNSCPKGAEYGKKEVISPTRVVTSSIPVEGGIFPRVSVKTKADIPKKLIFECMKDIHSAKVHAPVHIGDVLLTNAGGTGVDIIATKEVPSL